MPKIHSEFIDTRRELEGVSYEEIGNDELKLHCPFHDDKEPSLNLNLRKQVFVCHTCKERGNVIKLLAKLHNRSYQAEFSHLSQRYTISDIKIIHPDRVARACAAIWKHGGKMLEELYSRGLTDEMIRRARIGYHDGRITIPVFDQFGNCRNIRLYSPGAKRNKLSNTKGYNQLCLYRVKDLEHDRVWVCGGELKALVVGELLEGIGAVASTSGEGSWNPEWTRLFEGKTVYVCMDIDNAGQNAAIRIGNQLAPVAKAVFLVHLPLDRERYSKGDVNDYVGKEGATASDLLCLMDAAVPHKFTVQGPKEVELGTKSVDLRDARNTENHGFRLLSEGVIRTVSDTISHVPGKVRIRCDRSQPNCHLCHIRSSEVDASGGTICEISTHSRYLIPLARFGDAKQRDVVLEALSIPKCKSATTETVEHYSVHQAQLTPELRIDDDGGTELVTSYIVNYKPEVSSLCSLEARLVSDPMNSDAVLIIDRLEEADDMALPLTDAELDSLKVFQVGPEGIDEKLNEIYNDLEANVTGIFGRRDVHLLIDLAYHSPLFFYLDKKRINGWINVLLLGDTSQGKTEIRERFQEHYQCGEKVDCKNASIAGVLGGVRQIGNQWFLSWGRVPMHDRRIVFLEECKGLTVEEIARLTEMRSSGIAELQKIETARTYARTRLVWISNPRGSRRVNSYQYGISAISELVGSPEDLRRFDAAAIIAHEDIKSIESLRHEAESKYTSALCNRLIRWAWTLSPEEIEFPQETKATVARIGSELCGKYSETAPLVDRGTVRHKLGRLSAALAARLYAVGARGGLRVGPEHVEAIGRLLGRLYDAPSCAYDRFSRQRARQATITDEGNLRGFLSQLRGSGRLVRLLVQHEEIELADVEVTCDVDRDVARQVLSELLEYRAIEKRKRGTFRKTPAFLPILNDLVQNETHETTVEEEYEF